MELPFGIFMGALLAATALGLGIGYAGGRKDGRKDQYHAATGRIDRCLNNIREEIDKFYE